jgi:hypothetical protein
MSKRPAVNLADLTSEAAAPMTEAVQRAPRPASPPVAVVAAPEPAPTPSLAPARRAAKVEDEAKTENLEAMAFKVPKSFRKRFKQRAMNADLKLNQLLFEALDAWEEKTGLKK